MCYKSVHIKNQCNIFDFFLQYKCSVIRNDDHIYVHILNIYNNVSYVNILVSDTINITNIIFFMKINTNGMGCINYSILCVTLHHHTIFYYCSQ